MVQLYSGDLKTKLFKVWISNGMFKGMISTLKMDVDIVDQVENCSLVDVDQYKSAVWLT